MDELAGVFLNQVIERCGEKLTLSPEEVSSGRVQTADDALAAGLIADLAALEDLTRDLYKDRPLHIYSTTPSVAEQLGVAQMLFRPGQRGHLRRFRVSRSSSSVTRSASFHVCWCSANLRASRTKSAWSGFSVSLTPPSWRSRSR